MQTQDVESVIRKPYGRLADGREVFSYTLTNKNNVRLSVINYGGIITHLFAPDKNGVLEDIVLGFDTLAEYVQSNDPYFGAIIGRYGNRIKDGKFVLDGTEYTLAQNNNGQHLHGGLKGFDKVFWNIEAIHGNSGDSLELTYLSKDLEEGYPGNLQVKVRYTLTHDNKLVIRYNAETDRRTVINLTNHAYFNLTGNNKRDILGHQLKIAADRFVPVEKNLIPSGELRSVKNTPFDFLETHTIGERINDSYEQIVYGLGYDHTYVLSGDVKAVAATVSDPSSGRVMDLYTSEPGVQLYTGNFLNGLKGKNGTVYPQRYGFCLETQHYPDSPNQPSFPTVILNAGERYSSETIYHFYTTDF